MSKIENIGNTIQPTELSPEERTSRRLRVLKRAMLGFGQQFASQPCVVRDMCESGAKIQIDAAIALPRNFTLHVEIDGYKVECELVWHHPPFAGVHFISEKVHSSLARKQVLGDAETALSEQFQKEYELRERMQARDQEQLNALKHKNTAPQKKVTFGKRHFGEQG
jgi:hypothetical protein